MVKKRKMICFGRDGVWIAGETENTTKTGPQEWRLLRAGFAARRELTHYDGFLIFHEWQDGSQGGDYLRQFRIIRSKSISALQGVLYPDKEDKKPLYIERSSRGPARVLVDGDEITTNVGGLVDHLRQLQQLSRLKDVEPRWILAITAMNIWPDTYSGYLTPADGNVAARKPLTSWFSRPHSLLRSTVDVLERVIGRVAYLTSVHHEGLKAEDSESAIRGWLRTRHCLLSQLDALPEMPPSVESHIDEFYSRLNYISDVLRDCEHHALDPIASTAQEEIEKHTTWLASSPVAEEAVLSVQQQSLLYNHLRLRPSDIKDCIKDALIDCARELSRSPTGRARIRFADRLRVVVRAKYTSRDAPSITDEELLVRKAQHLLGTRLSELDASKRDGPSHDAFALIAAELIGTDYSKLAVAPPVTADVALHMLRAQPTPATDNVHLTYLHHVTDMLAAGNTDAKWFREGGPCACDIASNLVYVHPGRLMQLRDKVLASPFFLLLGKRASGKSVMTRLLAHYLWTVERMPVYFFAPYAPFDGAAVSREIRALQGKAVIIIEDMYRHTPCHLDLFRGIRNQSQRAHIVWTTHPESDDALGDLQDVFATFDRMVLSPVDEAKEIAVRYLVACGHVESPSLNCRSHKLAAQCEGNLWLLAHAVRGYHAMDGNGSFDDWVRDRVLHDLAKYGIYDYDVPGLLVALACFFQTDVLTEESHIRSLGFTSPTIKCALEHGLITRVGTDRHRLYGLQHSVLADLYWKYGDAYKASYSLPSYGESVVAYAHSSAPNALEPLLYGPPSAEIDDVLLQPAFLKLLLRKGLDASDLANLLVGPWRLLRKEPRGNIVPAVSRQASPLTPEQMAVLAEAIASSPVTEIAAVFEALCSQSHDWQMLLPVDYACLAHRIEADTDVKAIDRLLRVMHDTHGASGLKLATQLRAEPLSHLLHESDDWQSVLDCLAIISVLSPTLGPVQKQLRSLELTIADNSP